MSTSFNASLTRRSFLGGAAVCAGGAALAALGMPAPAFAAGDTFIYAIGGDPTVTPNPVTTEDRYGLMVVKLVYSPLWTVTDAGVNMFLADSYSVSEDGLTYTVKLRDGVTFNDGTPCTADDVVFSYQAIEDTPIAGGYSDLNYGEQGKVEARKVDDLTVELVLPFFNPAAVEALGDKFIMPKHLYEGVADFENNDVNAKGVGTGPYKLDEYQIGQYISFSANEDYFLGVPSIPKVVYKIVTNETTGMTAIQTGEVNAWIGTPSQVEQLDVEAHDLNVTPYSEGRVAVLYFNARRMTDEKVRQAFLYSLDRDQIAMAALLDAEYYDLAFTFLPPSNPWVNPDVETYEQDIPKAQELLAEAGDTHPTVKLAYSSNDSLQTTCAIMIQEQASQAGFNVELRGMDLSALAQVMKDENNDYDAYFGGYIMGIDPSKYEALFLTDAALNYSHHTLTEIDDLFNEGRGETDEFKRREIYNEIQQILLDQALIYPLYSNKRLLVTTSNVHEIEAAGLVPIYTFEDLSKLQMHD